MIEKAATAKMAAAGKGRCLVAVDYLQILPLAPKDSGRVTNTKDRVDLHVSALQRLAIRSPGNRHRRRNQPDQEQGSGRLGVRRN